MIAVSLVIPARDECDNIAPLLDELDGVLETLRVPCEIIVVDDGSTDGTDAVLREHAARCPRLRAVRLASPCGQTAALRVGLAESRGRVIATMDADLQNDPADLPALLTVLETRHADLVQGDRTGRRRDGPVKRLSSGVARVFRRLILGDSIRDTGCTLRVMRRPVAVALPLEYRGMHRFIPGIARELGFVVIEHPVSHRPRRAGRTHYGVLDRAGRGLADLFAVRWMHRRRQPPPAVAPITAPGEPPALPRITTGLSA